MSASLRRIAVSLFRFIVSYYGTLWYNKFTARMKRACFCIPRLSAGWFQLLLAFAHVTFLWSRTQIALKLCCDTKEYQVTSTVTLRSIKCKATPACGLKNSLKEYQSLFLMQTSLFLLHSGQEATASIVTLVCPAIHIYRIIWAIPNKSYEILNPNCVLVYLNFQR